ncbi:MAG: DUF167 domain-containing protein [Phycisphaerales bacterium]
MSGLPAFATVRGEALELRVKAVPGARRDEIAGVLGDRLKVRVSQPPEGGRANDAIAAVLAGVLQVPVRSVELVSAAANPQKTFRIAGGASEAARLCGLLLAPRD